MFLLGESAEDGVGNYSGLSVHIRGAENGLWFTSDQAVGAAWRGFHTHRVTMK